MRLPHVFIRSAHWRSLQAARGTDNSLCHCARLPSLVGRRCHPLHLQSYERQFLAFDLHALESHRWHFASDALVAQRIRASVSGTEGRRFDPCQGHKFLCCELRLYLYLRAIRHHH